MASGKKIDLSAEEMELITTMRKQKASTSVSQATTAQSGSSENTQSPTKEVPIEEADPSTPLSSPKEVKDSQSVAGRLRKRSAQSLTLKGTKSGTEEGATQKPKKAKKSKSIKIDLIESSSPFEVDKRFANREVLSPLIITEDFWSLSLSNDEKRRFGGAIVSFHSMLKTQGWDKLITEPFSVNEDAVRAFYAGMSFVPAKENAPATDIIVSWEDKMIPLNVKLISKILGIEAKGKGFNVLVKKRTWPKGREFKTKAETTTIIFGEPISGDLDSSLLALDKKLLHKFLIRNIVPRKENRGTVLINDVVLMEKIISGDLVDLPRLMLAHMQFCFSHDTHALPYPNLIEKILKFFSYYSEEIPETTFSSSLTLSTLHSMKFRAEPTTTREAPPPPLLEGPPAPIAPSSSAQSAKLDQGALLERLQGIEDAIYASARYIGKMILKTRTTPGSTAEPTDGSWMDLDEEEKKQAEVTAQAEAKNEAAQKDEEE